MEPRTFPTALLDDKTGERLPCLAGAGWTVNDRTCTAYGFLGGRVVNVRKCHGSHLWITAEIGKPCEAAATPHAALRLAGFALEA